MRFLPLIFANLLRKKVRTVLTIGSFAVALFLFGLLATIRVAFSQGVDVAGADRLMVINKVSIIQPLPLPYRDRILRIPGVKQVTFANWFGGVYIDERNFFAQFAISGASYLDMYPEFVLKDAERKAFLADRVGALAGRKLADKYGWKVGDQIPLRGTIYPGTWTFTLHGIYDGAEEGTDTSTFFFHFDYLNEAIKRQFPRRADQAGVFVEQLRDPEEAAAVSAAIDATFKNSLAETLTETEKAFQLGFVAMSEAILLAIQAVSYVVIVIIMAVMANTMAMTARERYGEYATLKALGFGNGFVAMLIFAESLGIALFGGLLGIAFTFPMAELFASTVGSILSGFRVSEETIVMQLVAALVIGVVAAAVPAWNAARIRIVDGLRAIG
jgi:putative ABC transport system permease protein